MRWLLLKDLQILKRSPGLLVLLVLYAVVIGVPVGYGVSAPPSKPKVAFVNLVGATDTTVSVGTERIDVSTYADQLFQAVDPVRVKTRAEALQAVRDGDALAALIIPADITEKLQSVIGLTGSPQLPTIEVAYSAENPIKRRYVEQTIKSRLADANAALTRRVTQVAASYIGIILDGGDFSLLGQSLNLLGLRKSVTELAAARDALPAGDPQRDRIERVRQFAQLAVDNLGFSGTVLNAVGEPIRVKQSTLGGTGSSLDGFAVAAALTIALLFVAVLLGAGMLALEREEHAFGRLVRGLVSRWSLLTEKVLLAGGVALVVSLLLTGLLSLFQSIDYGRAGAWLPGLLLGGLAFGALGVAIGALTRDVRAASLLAFLLSLPIAALALVPSGAVDSTAYDLIRVVSAAFPFRPTLQALDGGLNDAGDVLGPLAHLVVLALAYVVLARLALRRFDAR